VLPTVQPKRQRGRKAASAHQGKGTGRTGAEAGRVEDSETENRNTVTGINGQQFETASAGQAGRVEPVLDQDAATLAALTAEALQDNAPAAADQSGALPAGEAAPDTPPPAAQFNQAACARDIRGVLDMGIAWADEKPETPSKPATLSDVWTPDARQAVSERLAACFGKWGMSTPDWLARYEPEISLAIVLVPLVFASVPILKARNAPAPKPAGAAGAAAPIRAEGNNIAEPKASPISNMTGALKPNS